MNLVQATTEKNFRHTAQADTSTLFQQTEGMQI
jgi:hypothetical protein